MFKPLGILATAAALPLAAPGAANAFCGFYVSGGDAKLYNNATVVVLMCDGTGTVLSMQNNCQGPRRRVELRAELERGLDEPLALLGREARHLLGVGLQPFDPR